MDVNATEVKSTSIPGDNKFISGAEGSADLRKNAVSSHGQNPSASMNAQQTEAVVKSLESYMNALQTSLGFEVNADTDRVVVTITNRETKEVIRQIPPEELVSLQERMKELTGIIFSETV